jgi:hypothetical protein
MYTDCSAEEGTGAAPSAEEKAVYPSDFLLKLGGLRSKLLVAQYPSHRSFFIRGTRTLVHICTSVCFSPSGFVPRFREIVSEAAAAFFGGSCGNLLR